jgi:hypothetical protein
MEYDMRLNRSQIVTILKRLLGLCAVVLLSGCASIGGEKDADPEVETNNLIESPATTPKESTGSSLEVSKEPVVNRGGSGQISPVQGNNRNVEGDIFGHFAASLKQGLERFLPETMPALNWDRISTAVGGIVVLSLIYGLAFGLGRLPLRRRSPGLRGRGRHSGEQSGGSADQ